MVASPIGSAPKVRAVAGDFDDLLAANRKSAETFHHGGFDGVAHAGVAIVTCMDSRIDPLRMVGLDPGDAKIIRNPGGRVTELAMEALVLGVHLLEVRRILVVPHTRCAVATTTEAEVRAAITAADSRREPVPWRPRTTPTNIRHRPGRRREERRVRPPALR